MNDQELDETLNTWETPAAPPSMRAGLRMKFASMQVRKVSGVPWKWILALALGAGAVVGASLVSDGVIGADGGPWDDHTFVRRTQIVQPAIAKLNWWRLMSGKTTGRRWEAGRLTGSVYVHNRLTGNNSGYTWQALPAGGGEYLFTVLPLDPADVKEGAVVPLTKLPPPVRVRAGKSFDVPVYEGVGMRVIDRYELTANAARLAPPVDEALRDSTITLTNPKLYRNGAFAADSGGVVEASGLTANLEVKGVGRFILAVDRQTNTKYVAAGRVTGNTMEFEFGGESYRIVCTAPIATGTERPLYVYFRGGSASGTSFGSGGSASGYK